MSQETATYFVLPEGATQEEPCTWEEIEAMAGAGLLAPDTLIFFPEDNGWRRAADTQLAPFFSDEQAAAAPVDVRGEEWEAQYREVCDEIGHGSDWNPRVQAAELALKLDDRDAAVEHFRDALTSHPFHPRVVQEAKRLLSPTERATLPFLERVEPAWNDLPGMVLYPLRGAIHMVIPAALFAGLSFVPGGAAVSALLLFVWGVEITRTGAAPSASPPSWRNFVGNPLAVVRSLQVAGVVGLEIYGPFLLIAAIMAATSNDGILAVVGKSPLILVPMLIVTLLYVPAVLTLAANPKVRIGWIGDPRNVLAAIGKMETEYMICVAMFLALFVVWLVITAIFGKLPFVSNAMSAASGTYLALAGGFIASRLHSRFRDHFAGPSRA